MREIMSEVQFLDRIEWLPKHAAFQMSQNKQWARHSNWEAVNDKEAVAQEVWEAWGLVPIHIVTYYCYFGTEKKRKEWNSKPVNLPEKVEPKNYITP